MDAVVKITSQADEGRGGGSEVRLGTLRDGEDTMKRRKFLTTAARAGLMAGVVGNPMELFSAEKQNTDQHTFSFVVIGDPHVGITPAGVSRSTQHF